LAKADLASAGFTKTKETQIITGEDGKKVTKEVTYYTVQDACSNVSYWEKIIHDRLPTFSEKLTRKVIDEVEKRIGNRATEYCQFGLEVHFKLCSHAEKEKEIPAKRGLFIIINCNGPCACCLWCGKAKIQYVYGDA
jgi:hypothetical protein